MPTNISAVYIAPMTILRVLASPLHHKAPKIQMLVHCNQGVKDKDKYSNYIMVPIFQRMEPSSKAVNKVKENLTRL